MDRTKGSTLTKNTGKRYRRATLLHACAFLIIALSLQRQEIWPSYSGQGLEIVFASKTDATPAVKDKIDEAIESVWLDEEHRKKLAGVENLLDIAPWEGSTLFLNSTPIQNTGPQAKRPLSGSLRSDAYVPK